MTMSLSFIILGAVVLASAAAAVSLRNLVRCALCLSVAFAGLAAMYLQLGAQFVGFAQVLVYIGAVAILILFATLLTRGSEPPGQGIFSPGLFWGIGTVAAVFGVFVLSIASSRTLVPATAPEPSATVRQVGAELMSRGILPLEVVGLLLTAALIGAVIIAVQEGAKARVPHETPQAGAAKPTNIPLP
jgi:NADH:ubiquinone oxidoreductase subunit 6 (subunit J)